MNRAKFLGALALLLLGAAVCFAAGPAPATGSQTIIHPAAGKQAPPVVIYTLSTCPHCQEAKNYMTEKKIPFVNREVDTDDANMELLVKIYDEMGVPEEKRGVPFIVVGDRIRLQGFNKEKLQKALSDVSGAK